MSKDHQSSVPPPPPRQIADRKKFLETTLLKIASTLNVRRLSSTISKKLETTIANQINLLEENIKVSRTDISLKEFSNNIASKTIELVNAIYKENKKATLTRVQLQKLNPKISKGLQKALQDEIILKKEINGLEDLNVIVEAHKLREIKPENMITIKMTISEQGMEWVNMEDKDGEIVNKLLPE